jgi:hypothetical protein
MARQKWRFSQQREYFDEDEGVSIESCKIREESMLRRLHLVFGIGGLIVFLLTGQYMYWVLDHLSGMAGAPRLFFRSAHIYLLWASLLNLSLGCYLRDDQARFRRHLQSVASAGILAAPCLLAVSFFMERYNAQLTRPLAHLAIFAAAIGMTMYVALRLFVQRRAADGGVVSTTP